jgi:hypothetical protein
MSYYDELRTVIDIPASNVQEWNDKALQKAYAEVDALRAELSIAKAKISELEKAK